jgi:hypothetical protein
MSRHVLSLSLLLCIFCAACEDPNSSPGNGQEPNPKDSNGFRVLGILADSLYGGEELKIITQELSGERDRMKLFIGFEELYISRVVGDTVCAQIPAKREGGKIRLYKLDSVLASGDVSVTIFRSHKSEFNPDWYGLLDQYIYNPGDTLWLRFDWGNYPETLRPVRVTYDHVPLPVFRTISDEYIYTALPKDAVDGKLRFYLFDSLRKTIDIDIRYLENELLVEGLLNVVYVGLSELAGTVEIHKWKPDGTSELYLTHNELNKSEWLTFPSQITVPVTPSSISIDTTFGNDTIRRIRLHLTKNPDNSWSGPIRVEQVMNEGKWDQVSVLFSATLDDARWSSYGHTYSFNFEGKDIGTRIRDIYFELWEDYPGFGQHILKSVSNNQPDGPDKHASVSFTLRPRR